MEEKLVSEIGNEFQIVGPWWRVLNCLINCNERKEYYLKRKARYSYSLFGQMAHFILLILACIKMWSAKQIIKGWVGYLNAEVLLKPRFMKSLDLQIRRQMPF